VLQNGNVFEKAGVNVSVVYGQMPPDAYRAATGESGTGKEMIPFFAAGKQPNLKLSSEPQTLNFKHQRPIP